MVIMSWFTGNTDLQTTVVLNHQTAYGFKMFCCWFMLQRISTLSKYKLQPVTLVLQKCRKLYCVNKKHQKNVAFSVLLMELYKYLHLEYELNVI